MTRQCLDLFAGLGGFSMAAHANGVETACQVEVNPFLLAGLKRAWPKSNHHEDIKTFDARPYRGIWAVMGGPPCQPASRAGKQQGEDDDRWLWPQAIRVVEESEPTWFLFENPPGIRDVGLDGIIFDLERLGYEVQPISIPACAVDSPQDRDRIWILGHLLGPGLEVVTSQPGNSRQEQPAIERTSEGCSVASGYQSPSIRRTDQPERESKMGDADGRDAKDRVLADSKIKRKRTGLREDSSGKIGRGRSGDCLGAWSDFFWVPFESDTLRRAPTGLYELADGVSYRIPRKFRAPLIGALGNAIVWPVAEEIIRAMIKSEES